LRIRQDSNHAQQQDRNMKTATANVVQLPVAVALVCSQCGASGSGSCHCGVAYVPASLRAAAALDENSARSDRAIAAEIGVSDSTVLRARRKAAGASCEAPEKRAGRDGKSYRVVKRRREWRPRTDPTVQAFLEELSPLGDICNRLGDWLATNPTIDHFAKDALMQVLITASMNLQDLPQKIDGR